MNPVVLHVIRPYASEAEFLAAEAWSVDARSMLLLEQEALEPDTIVIFDVTLESGERLVRAEGRVAALVAPTAEHAGGLRVRFKRYGSQTKAFVERAIAHREAALAAAASVAREPAPAEPAAVEASPEGAAVVALATPGPGELAVEALPLAAPARVATIAVAAAETFVAAHAAPAREATSGIHRRPAPSVAAPENRDELLARLRERLAKTLALNEPEAPASHRTG